MIQNTNQLNTHQLRDLEKLMSLCKIKDGSIPNVYTHILTQERVFPASLLYYDQKHLVGFLSVYFFYDDAVEIALMVAPKSRKRGIAKKLLKTIYPLIESQNFQKLIFGSPAHFNDGWFNTHGYSFTHREYYMERDDLNPLVPSNKSLTIRKATMDDIPLLISMDEACFPKHQGNLNDRFDYLLNGKEYLILLAFENSQAIGKAHIRWQNEGASLSDIAIIPQSQGKGYGTALISHCINLALSEGKPKLNLDVETHNVKALNLYMRLGFSIKNACDYWTITLNQLLHQILSK